MKLVKLSSVLFIILQFQNVFGENILFMSSVASKSHSFWDKTIAGILRNRGHNITMLTHFPEENGDNFTTIHLEDFFEKYCLKESVEQLAQFSLHSLFWAADMTCSIYLKTNGFKKIMQQVQEGFKFDLIFFDLTGGPCFWPIMELSGSPPVIGTSPFGIVPYVARGFGVSSQIAYYPFYSLPYSNNMTFYQRFINYYTHIYEMILKEYYWTKTRTLQKQFFGEDVQHYSAYERNISLLFANYDPILNYPKPIPPNVIPLGGLHLKEAQPLPKDMQTYINSNKYGVIVVSLGTIIQAESMKIEIRDAFLNAFAKLNETVIWKYESDIPNLPKNVKLVQYLPQMDLLGHQNIMAFIGHGGALSTQEAMYFGVPFIGIPIYLDQHSLVAKIVHSKAGLRLDYHRISSSYILKTVREVIHNPIYKINAKKISRHYRSQPDHPQERVIYYTEHVIREGGADWLRPTGADMSFFQLNLLDVWLTLIVLIAIIMWSGIKISRKIKKVVEIIVHRINEIITNKIKKEE